jgi:hypothetical protein
VLAGDGLPADKLVIPQSWQKQAIPSVPAPEGESVEETLWMLSFSVRSYSVRSLRKNIGNGRALQGARAMSDFTSGGMVPCPSCGATYHRWLLGDSQKVCALCHLNEMLVSHKRKPYKTLPGYLTRLC